MAKPFDPFTPPGPVDRALLEAYVRGTLDARARHRVELAMQDDPLVREAVEGLLMPGAVEGLQRLPARPPGAAPSMAMRWTAGVLAVAALTAGLLLVREDPRPTPPVTALPAVPDRPYRADSAIAAVAAELQRAEPPPHAEHIGHARSLDPPVAAPPPPSDTITTPVLPIRRDTMVVIPAPEPAAPAPAAERRPRSDRKLAYVHDLELVDPSELYPRSPLMTDLSGVPAGYADAEDRQRRTEPPRTMRYLDLMDQALGKFVRDDHRGCLEDLLFLLAQYPKDVNARFYAGLCCYNLGLSDRAAAYMQAVLDDPIDTFHEEAAWYLALSMERAQGMDQARPCFQRVADGGGFYAAQARARLHR
jgi:hypothetical protein